MQFVWTLMEETNLLNGKKASYGRITRNVRTFQTFEAAKRAFRERIADYAGAESDLFDGDGNVRNLTKELDYYLEEEDNETLSHAGEILRGFFLDEPLPSEAAEAMETVAPENAPCGFTLDDDFIRFCTPKPTQQSTHYGGKITAPMTVSFDSSNMDLDINALRMNDPDQCYFCRVKGAAEAEDDEFPAYLHLELTKTEVEVSV